MPAKPKYIAGLLNGFEIISPLKSQYYTVKCPVCKCLKKMRIDGIRQNKSCGCLNIGESHYNFKHGFDKNSPIYYMWHDMKNRCYNVKSDHFNSYGKRGIIVCEEWKNNFKLFCDWAISNGWEKGLQIDRINNDGIYSPFNCRFVTKQVNSRKKQNTIWVDYMGKKTCLSEACELMGLSRSKYKTIWAGMRRGHSFEYMILRTERNLTSW